MRWIMCLVTAMALVMVLSSPAFAGFEAWFPDADVAGFKDFRADRWLIGGTLTVCSFTAPDEIESWLGERQYGIEFGYAGTLQRTRDGVRANDEDGVDFLVASFTADLLDLKKWIQLGITNLNSGFQLPEAVSLMVGGYYGYDFNPGTATRNC